MLTIQLKKANFPQSPYGKVSDLATDYDDVTSLMTHEENVQIDYLPPSTPFRRLNVSGAQLYSLDVSSKRGKRMFLMAPGLKSSESYIGFTAAYWTFFLKQFPTQNGSYNFDDYVSEPINGNVTLFDGGYPAARNQPWVQSFVIPDDANYVSITLSPRRSSVVTEGIVDFKVYIEK